MRLTAIRGPLGLALLCLTFAGSATAEYNASIEYRDHIKVAKTVQPLGDRPFGEEINLYKGGLSFKQTDISYPGIGPTITLTRTYTIGAGSIGANLHKDFGDWAFAIPRIETIVPGDRYTDHGDWKTSGGYSRCSSFGPVLVSPFASFGMQWWNGYQMITPDGNSRPLLRRVAENTLSPSSGTYNIVTSDNWMISCIPVDNEPSGEGFLALAPDGSKYYFNHLTYTQPIEELLYEAHTPIVHLPRKMGYMLLTKIEDRFGNYITYNYNGAVLTSVTGSDGRQVTITRGNYYISNITVQPGTSAAQTWNYTYGTGLASVELPDHSKWQFSMNGVNTWSTMPDSGASCGGSGSTVYTDGPGDMTITHPSGLVGVFNVSWHELGRSKVPNVCNHGTLDSPEYDALPPYYLAVALDSKSISGPGVAAQNWTYTYGVVPSTDPNCASAYTGCVAANTVEVGAPDGTSTRYTHSAEWGPYEGKLLSVVAGISPSSPNGLRTVTREYAATTQGPFPARIGDNIDGTYAVNNGPIEYFTPEKKSTTTQQGVSFVRTVNSFDQYANPLSVTRASTGNAGGNFSRTEITTYSHNLAKWVIGQVATVTDSASGSLTSKTDYDATTANPWKRYGFGGLLQQTLTYNADGTIATVKDGNNKVTTLGSWYRGIPRLITFPTAATMQATVDDGGKILSTTDELQSTTAYGYDALGRLAGITYPAGDTVAWNPMSRGFVPVASVEYGLPAGHWSETVSTGNGKTTTYYDARWLPLLTLTQITGNAASKSFVIRRFDSLGREVFKSYPLASVTTVSDAVPGTTTTYDAMGRVVAVAQDSELGVLTTSTSYLTGFQTRVTNPRGYSTTTSYQVFDTPSTDAPVRIDAPQGVSTVIMRDTFGAPLSITRSGPGN